MWERLRRWLHAIPYTDPLERQQATLMQQIELSKLGVALALLPTVVLTSVGASIKTIMPSRAWASASI
jgi:hypothetical protein